LEKEQVDGSRETLKNLNFRILKSSSIPSAYKKQPIFGAFIQSNLVKKEGNRLRR